MGPLPKRKHSRGRRNRRRAHDALPSRQLLRCENCGQYHLAHHVCGNCGYYHGETVVQVQAQS